MKLKPGSYCLSWIQRTNVPAGSRIVFRFAIDEDGSIHPISDKGQCCIQIEEMYSIKPGEMMKVLAPKPVPLAEVKNLKIYDKRRA